MPNRDPFGELVKELQGLTTAAMTRAHLNGPDLRRVLGFIAKVSHVAEQAFQDVLTVLVDVKYLTPEDLDRATLIDLQKRVELLTVRSHYRDVEEICSRLHHLEDQYQEHIAPLLQGVVNAGGWEGVFGLINEHEGRLIHLVHQTTWELRDQLASLDLNSLPTVTTYATERLSEVHRGLDELRDLSNKILGLSGREGLLELTSTGAVEPSALSLFLNQGSFAMSRDHYEVGQAGAVGPGAHAHHMNFNQIWNQAAGSIDTAQLARELSELREALSKEAADAEEYVALGEVAAAEKAAKQGDGPRALQHLKQAGSWVWDIGTKVGVGVAIAAAKTALGI